MSQQRPRTLGGLILYAVLGSLLLAFVASISLSRSYWGYWLSPPALDTRILEARRFQGVAFLERSDDPNAPWTMQDQKDTTVPEELTFFRGNSYDSAQLRVLHALDQHGALDTLPLKKVGELPPLPELLQSTGAFFQPKPGYEQSATWVTGLALEAEGGDGRRLLFVGLHGGEVSNDHTPIYEFLFQAAPGSQHFEQVSVNRWFVDVAGIEGLEWYVMLPLFFCPAVLVSILFAFGVHWYRTRHRARKHPQGVAGGTT